MRSDDYRLSRETRDPSLVNGERLKNAEELNESFDDRARLEYTGGYVGMRSHRQVRKFLLKKFGIETGDDFKRLPLDVANHFVCELVRFRNVFGTVGFIDKVVVDRSDIPDEAEAAFAPYDNAIILRSDYIEPPTKINRSKTDENGNPKAYQRSTGSSRHPYRHEIGHALYHFVVQRIDSEAAARARELHERYFTAVNGQHSKGAILLSKYAEDSASEMFAEAVSSLMDKGSPSSFALAIVKYVIFGEKFDDIEK